MAKDRKTARPPMLYIAQPDFKQAEVSMQSSFRAPSSKQQETGEGKRGSVHEKEIRVRSQNTAQLKETPIEKAIADETKRKPQAEKAKKSREGRQRFQELSLEEKVQYFFKQNPHVPKVKCEVSTSDSQYKGYIIDYKDGKVFMKTFKKPYQKEVPFESIHDIRLMGF